MTSYCTYITYYHGDKLPPFYIGYTSVENISNGYHGSVSSNQYKPIWLQELKDNPQLFETIIQQTYATREEAVAAEIELLESVQAHKNPLYINMSIGGKKFFPRKWTTEYRNELRKKNMKEAALRRALRRAQKVNAKSIESKVNKNRKIRVPWNKGMKKQTLSKEEDFLEREKYRLQEGD